MLLGFENKEVTPTEQRNRQLHIFLYVFLGKLWNAAGYSAQLRDISERALVGQALLCRDRPLTAVIFDDTLLAHVGNIFTDRSDGQTDACCDLGRTS